MPVGAWDWRDKAGGVGSMTWRISASGNSQIPHADPSLPYATASL